MQIRLFVLVEDAYTDSPWCKKVLEGIHDNCIKKNYSFSLTEYTQFSANGALFLENIDPPIIVLGYTRGKILAICQELRYIGVQFMLINYRMPPNLPNAHCVLSTFDNALYALYSKLFADGRTRPAMVGVNREVYIEMSKAKAFQAVLEEFFYGSMDRLPYSQSIFYFLSTIKECFEAFFQQIDQYDNILCANDFVAVYFLRNLNERGYRVPEDMQVSSFIDTNLGHIYASNISSVSINYDEIGKQVVNTYSYIQKNTSFSPLTIYIDSHTIKAGLPIELPQQNYDYSKHPPSPLYQDPEIQEMRTFEILLSQCDNTDRQILNGLAHDRYYSSIANDCFISESTVKYRVKEMLNILGLKSRKKLAEQIKTYLR